MSEDLLVQDVHEEYRKSRSYFRVAKVLDISMEKVKSILGDHIPQPTKRREALFGGRGRPELEKYIVATKYVTDEWDNADEDITYARCAYEAGSHEMVTGRDGDTLILYLIPRATPQPRTDYFSTGGFA